MIEHLQLQSLIRRITHASDNVSFKGSIIHPQRDWIIGIGVTILLLVGVGVINWQFYTIANTTPELTAEEMDTVVSYRGSLVERALTEYQDLADRYERNSFVASNPAAIPIEADVSTTTATSTADSMATSSVPVATSTPSSAATATTSVTDDTIDESSGTPTEVPMLAN